MEQSLIDITDQNLLVNCQYGQESNANMFNVAQDFCRIFSVKSIIIHHNDLFIQVDQKGLVKAPTFKE